MEKAVLSYIEFTFHRIRIVKNHEAARLVLSRLFGGLIPGQGEEVIVERSKAYISCARTYLSRLGGYEDPFDETHLIFDNDYDSRKNKPRRGDRRSEDRRTEEEEERREG